MRAVGGAGIIVRPSDSDRNQERKPVDMRRLLELFGRIALLREVPQTVPYSGFLAGLVVAGYGVMSMVLVLARGSGVGRAVSEVALDASLITAFFWVVLALERKLSRLLQSVTAMLGAQTAPTAVGVPLTFALTQLPDGHGLRNLAAAALLIVIFWSLAISAHIFRHATDRSLAAGVVLALLNFFVTQLVYGALYSG